MKQTEKHLSLSQTATNSQKYPPQNSILVQDLFGHLWLNLYWYMYYTLCYMTYIGT